MFVLNVDKPEKMCTLHDPSRCNRVLLVATPRKGINGEIRDDGGWVPVSSQEAAREYGVTEFPAFEYRECRCMKL